MLLLGEIEVDCDRLVVMELLELLALLELNEEELGVAGMNSMILVKVPSPILEPSVPTLGIELNRETEVFILDSV